MRSECHTSEDPGNLLGYAGSRTLRHPSTIKTYEPLSDVPRYPFPVLTADGKLDFSPK
jgi:hypothetical protein